jgi:hypothetical protein
MVVAEPIQITRRIAKAFESLGISYFIGGSLASSLHGIPRATQDVDIVADIRKEHVDLLVAALKDEFYIDADMINEAIQRNASFNVLHFATMFKVDIFIPKGDKLSKEEIYRREQYPVSGDPSDYLFLASAEDVILQKLYWYQKGDCVSERQWNDILGILQVQSEKLDRTYLINGALQRGVSGLLERALEEVK